MKHYIGLDVSMKETAICTVNQDALVVEETTVATDPDAIANYLEQLDLAIEEVGLESGSLSHWLTEELLQRGLPVKCIDARHCAAFLSMRINKTDRNDARGIAEVMRCRVYREVHLKERSLREVSALLTSRKQLVQQRTQGIMCIRGILKPFGLRLGSISKTKKGLSSLLEKLSSLNECIQYAVQKLVDALLGIIESISALDREIKTYVQEEPKALLLTSVPGVGPITALKYLVEIGDPTRFRRSRSVGAYLGLTPKQYSSGETQKQGGISKCGCKVLRSLLVEAAIVLMTRTKSWSKLKVWGLRLMKRMSLKQAASAVARKLAVIMHKMLSKNERFRFGKEEKKLQAA